MVLMCSRNEADAARDGNEPAAPPASSDDELITAVDDVVAACWTYTPTTLLTY